MALAFGGPRLEILVSGKQQGLTLHPDATLRQGVPTPPTPGSPPATASGAGPDVLGIRLGMELSDAERIVAGHMPGHGSFEIAQRTPVRSNPFGTVRVLVAADNSEAIALVTQPKTSGTRIVAVSRHLFGGPGAYDREALIADLPAKYGGEPLRADALLHWGGQSSAAETVCHVMIGTVDLGPWTDASGRTPRWQDYLPAGGATDFRGPGPMYWLGLRAPSPERAPDDAACLPTVAVYIAGAGPRASEFTLWLTDSKAAMGPPAASPTPAPATARPKL